MVLTLFPQVQSKHYVTIQWTHSNTTDMPLMTKEYFS